MTRTAVPTRLALSAVGAGVVLTVALTATRVWTADGDAGTSCPEGPHPLAVAAAPEIAPALTAATTAGPGGILGPAADCLAVRVVSAAPADLAAAVREDGPAQADVWVPDSTLWTAPLVEAGRLEPGDVGAPVARSPLVLALRRDAAERLGGPDRALDVPALVAEPGSSRLRLGLPDVARSAAGSAGLAAVTEAVAASPDGRERVAAVYRTAATDLPEDPEARLAGLAEGPSLAVPVPEQAVHAHSRRAGAVPLVGAPLAGAPELDYPLVVLTADPAGRSAAGRLAEVLAGPAWAERARAEGFRAPGDGTAAAPDPQRVADVVRAFEVVTRGTRMLAVLDVSGSMAAVVPGTDRRRIELATAAAGGGLALYGDDAHIGFWVFSTDLTPTSDYRQLVPIGPLGVREDGVPGRQALARALAEVRHVPDGDTGLYDAVLAGVRAVRQGWDPDRVNSVVLITDGRDEDPAGIALPDLLATLRAEAGAQPVPVIAIAYGPESDIAALEQITRATGGSTYAVPDPRRIGEVLQDALASRPCRPDC